MATEIDATEITNGLKVAVDTLPRAAALGQEIGSQIDRIYLVACGSANRAMQGIQYWADHASTKLEVRTFFPAEFMAINPPKLNERTLVILASKSGTTPETVQAAEFLKDRPCRTIVLTQVETSPLATLGDDAFFVGATSESFVALFMLMQAIVAGALKTADNWPLFDKLMASLPNLPSVIVAAARQNEARATEDSRLYKDDDKLYFVASGPVSTSAYVFGVCILMEMLWIHAYPIDAAEFFHGPFEIVTPETPLVLLLGEDPSRPLMERVKRFAQKTTERVMIYDSKDYAMEGIAPEIRAIVAPYVIQSALKRMSVRLSIWRDQPLSTRRYMWKSEY
jgi:fructoselysine 6-phosphate deglycase